ncbi:MAG: sulfotransferase [Rhodanobacteraceae bacterium]
MASENPQDRAAWRPAVRVEPALASVRSADDVRTRELPARVQRLLSRAQQWFERREFGFADRTLQEALLLAPEHPELLRLRAVTLHVQQRYAEAVALLRRAAVLRPEDALIYNNLGSALGESGDLEGAMDAFRQATRATPDLAASWFNLGKAFDTLLRSEDAEAAFARAIELDPTHQAARVLHANVLKTQGRLDDAAAGFRQALAAKPDDAEAWAGLIGMKTSPATADELSELERLYRRADLGAWDRSLIGFAYALALEAAGRHHEAFETTVAVNALRRAQLDWNTEGAREVINGIADAFAPPLTTADDAQLGNEVIFLVGMPRSGSTLAEQILAAHPQVQGAGEIGDVTMVLREESVRRGVDFPDWVAQASAADWARLGANYLERTARWRGVKPRSTDKSLQNWQLLGAIRAMLPGARIIDCRRDPLETCWSAYKHQFARDLPFTYNIDELAAYWRDYDRLMTVWQERFPGRILRHDYEAMLDDPEPRIRALLEFCGLPFDAACLRFHEAERDVRTASAAQVRAPLRRDSARAHQYGPLLDPLRRALGISV